jgi:hypothetical protein
MKLVSNVIMAHCFKPGCQIGGFFDLKGCLEDGGIIHMNVEYLLME